MKTGFKADSGTHGVDNLTISDLGEILGWIGLVLMLSSLYSSQESYMESISFHNVVQFSLVCFNKCLAIQYYYITSSTTGRDPGLG